MARSRSNPSIADTLALLQGVDRPISLARYGKKKSTRVANQLFGSVDGHFELANLDTVTSKMALELFDTRQNVAMRDNGINIHDITRAWLWDRSPARKKQVQNEVLVLLFRIGVPIDLGDGKIIQVWDYSEFAESLSAGSVDSMYSSEMQESCRQLASNLWAMPNFFMSQQTKEMLDNPDMMRSYIEFVMTHPLYNQAHPSVKNFTQKKVLERYHKTLEAKQRWWVNAEWLDSIVRRLEDVLQATYRDQGATYIKRNNQYNSSMKGKLFNYSGVEKFTEMMLVYLLNMYSETQWYLASDYDRWQSGMSVIWLDMENTMILPAVFAFDERNGACQHKKNILTSGLNNFHPETSEFIQKELGWAAMVREQIDPQVFNIDMQRLMSMAEKVMTTVATSKRYDPLLLRDSITKESAPWVKFESRERRKKDRK